MALVNAFAHSQHITQGLLDAAVSRVRGNLRVACSVPLSRPATLGRTKHPYRALLSEHARSSRIATKGLAEERRSAPLQACGSGEEQPSRRCARLLLAPENPEVYRHARHTLKLERQRPRAGASRDFWFVPPEELPLWTAAPG